MKFKADLEFAKTMDKNDPLKRFRSQYFFPKINGKRCIYFCGNSLGLQPIFTELHINTELKKWADYAVEGHFHNHEPWLSYHKLLTEGLAHIVGAKNEEVVAMGSLTANIHVLFTSFYRPDMNRFKILIEDGAFGSDIYAVESQINCHGNDIDFSLVRLKPRDGEHTLRTEDILAAIEENKNELALVFLGGVNYYTGQVLDMAQITKHAQQYGIFVGFDLAHAVGNVELHLHDWNVDFATWCSYKYLNAGPGGISGIFIHENHFSDTKIKRLAGWWGHKEDTRFQMPKKFVPAYGAEAWQQSNIPVFQAAALKASLDLFMAARMPNLRHKSIQLIDYLLFLLDQITDKTFEILTPRNVEERGSQLSLFFHNKGKEVFDELKKQGVIADWREPNVIRIAPTAMYNNFEDVFRFYDILNKITV